ncbi:MAG: hypothetical protein ACXIUZ_00680 [Lysobacteraceae bacterium]
MSTRKPIPPSIASVLLNFLGRHLIARPEDIKIGAGTLPKSFYYDKADRDMPHPEKVNQTGVVRYRIAVDYIRRKMLDRVALVCTVAGFAFCAGLSILAALFGAV